MLDEIEMQM